MVKNESEEGWNGEVGARQREQKIKRLKKGFRKRRRIDTIDLAKTAVKEWVKMNFWRVCSVKAEVG